MPQFQWYNKYSVNNEELDNHHKKLFDIFNKLYENCLRVDNINNLGPIIDELISYSNYHFAEEEQFMADNGYKDKDSHMLEHREFTQKALQLRQIENLDDYENNKELMAYLGNWLLNHVVKEDTKYRIK